MSQYLYGQHDQIVKGHSALRPGSPAPALQQGLDPAGLGNPGTSSINTEAFPASDPFNIPKGAVPREVVAAQASRFGQNVANRFGSQRPINPRARQHTPKSRVSQVQSAAEQYLIAPDRQQPGLRVSSRVLEAQMANSSVRNERPAPPVRPGDGQLGFIAEKAQRTAQQERIQMADRAAMAYMNAERAANFAAIRGTEVPDPLSSEEKAAQDTGLKKGLLIGGGVALVAITFAMMMKAGK